MNRQQTLLGVLGVIIILVLFYMFAFKPQQEELAEVEAEIEEALAQESSLEARIATLQEVRARAPEIEAALATAESIIPREQALPSALRQLQLAADDAGAELTAVTPGRPVETEGEIAELAELTVNVVLSGSYFQLVDFLRRVEDPAITPRGIIWSGVTIAAEEYPTLTATMSGRMFALLPAPPAGEVPEPGAVATEPATDDATEPDVEVTVEEDAA